MGYATRTARQCGRGPAGLRGSEPKRPRVHRSVARRGLRRAWPRGAITPSFDRRAERSSRHVDISSADTPGLRGPGPGPPGLGRGPRRGGGPGRPHQRLGAGSAPPAGRDRPGPRGSATTPLGSRARSGRGRLRGRAPSYRRGADRADRPRRTRRETPETKAVDLGEAATLPVQLQLSWTPGRIIAWAANPAGATDAARRPGHPPQGGRRRHRRVGVLPAHSPARRPPCRHRRRPHRVVPRLARLAGHRRTRRDGWAPVPAGSARSQPRRCGSPRRAAWSRR